MLCFLCRGREPRLRSHKPLTVTLWRNVDCELGGCRIIVQSIDDSEANRTVKKSLMTRCGGPSRDGEPLEPGTAR